MPMNVQRTEVITIESSDSRRFDDRINAVYDEALINAVISVIGFSTDYLGPGGLVQKTIVLKIVYR
jgi:hypothetical protein